MSGLTGEQRIEVMEMLRQIMKKMDENHQSLKEGLQSVSKKLDDCNKDLRESTSRSIDATMEEDEGKKIQTIKETEEVKMEERRTMRPRNARITKELIEMTRGGLINVVNLPIINLSLIHI